MAQVIQGSKLGQKLVEAGILPANTRRFVIDCAVNDVVKLYVECYGDTRIIGLLTPENLHDAVVIRTEIKASDVS